MAITALPTPPSSSSPSNFDTRADAFLGALPTFVTEANALQTDVNTKQSTASTAATTATTQATTATSQAALAAASAAAAAASASATLWVSGTNYTAGAVVYSPTNYATYRTTTSGTSSTDPAADTTGRWVSAMLPTAEAVGLPAVRPSLLLDFLHGGPIDPRVQVVRSTVKTRINARGLVETLLANDLRPDHVGATRAPRGLRVEGARTNLLLYSAAFDSWTAVYATVSANATTAPDGTATADNIVGTNTAGQRVTQTVTAASTAQHTFSVMLKAGTATTASLLVYNGGTAANVALASVDLTAGTISATTGTAAIESVGNGWYLCSITSGAGAISSGASLTCYIYPSPVALGSGAISAWGAQMEAGIVATSRIATAGTTASRAADAVRVTSTDFSEAVNTREFTVVVGYEFPASGPSNSGGNMIASLDDGTSDNRHSLYSAAGSSNVLGYGYVGGAIAYGLTQALASGPGVVVLAAQADDIALAVPGAAVSTDTSASMPTVTRLSVGHLANASGYELDGWVRFIAIFPGRLSNTQLQALATSYA